jgi:hypothetical protein
VDRDPTMVSWSGFEAAVPELAASVAARFAAHRHHTVATLRRDGAPRISGTEIILRDGELWLGSMPGARKAQDLRRDPRLALHSASEDPDDDDPAAWPGDAKLSGEALEVEDADVLGRVLGAQGAADAHLFRVEVREVVTTQVSEDGAALLIRLWTPHGGLRTFRRS